MIERVIEIFIDGHTGLARRRDMLEVCGTYVPEKLDRGVQEVSGLVEIKLSKDQFERFWGSAVQRVQFETGIPLTT